MKKYSQILIIIILFISLKIYSQQTGYSWIGRADSLINSNKNEEALNYLNSLRARLAGDEKFKQRLNLVLERTDSLYDKEISDCTELLKSNPSDRSLVKKIALLYKSRNYLDNAIEILGEYLRDLPDGSDKELRYLFSEYCFMNYDWNSSSKQIDRLLSSDPDNPTYRLLKAQLCIRTVSNLQTAENYLLDLFSNNQEDTTIIRELISLSDLENKKEESERYKSLLRKIKLNENNSKEIGAAKEIMDDKLPISSGVQNSLNDSTFSYRIRYYCFIGDTAKALLELKRAEEKISEETGGLIELAEAYAELNQVENAEKIYRRLRASEIADDAKRSVIINSIDISKKYLKAKRYADAAIILHDIEAISGSDQINSSVQKILIHYSGSLIEEKQYSEAQKLFGFLNEVITDDTLKDDLYAKKIKLGDSLLQNKRLDECNNLYKEIDKISLNEFRRSELDQRELFLGDLYAQEMSYGPAETVYRNLIKYSKDTSTVRIARERIDWLPTNGKNRRGSVFSNIYNFFIPGSFKLHPFSTFYHDNQKLDILSYGVHASAEYFESLLLGGSFDHFNLKSSFSEKYFDRYDLRGGFRILKSFSIKGEYSILHSPDEQDINPKKIIVDFNLESGFSLTAFYERSDSRLLLYSPFLLRTKLSADHLYWLASYNYQDLILISSNYNYYKIDDGNKGNDIEIKFGRKFFKNGFVGYEYYFTDYLFFTSRYYTPENFDTHCIWTEWFWKYDNLDFKVGAKLGYAPTDDYSVFAIDGEMEYHLLKYLIVSSKIGYASGVRINRDYRSITASVGLRWKLL